MNTPQALPFGKRIRQLRVEKGMTQRDLSARVGIDFTYLSKIENSRAAPPSDTVIEKLARELGADLEELLSLAGKVSQDEVRGAVAEDSRVGVLFRKLQSRSLTEEQIRDILKIANSQGKTNAPDR